MICKNCGKRLIKNAKFCKECGTKVENENKIPYESNTLVGKGLATASLIIGVVSFFIGFFIVILPIIGLILGICQKGKCGEKTAGIILNISSLVLSALFWVFVVLFVVFNYNVKNYESTQDNRGNSDVIINDDYENDYYNLESIFE